MRPSLTGVALATVGLLLTACGDATGDGDSAADPATEPTSAPSSSAPTAVPAADGPVTTVDPVTVLDDGDGAELCLGAVAESYPPQCSGVPLEGWDWADHPEHERSSGTRWGDFVVTGTFDGNTLSVTEVLPAAEHKGTDPVDDPLGTPCEEPEGGWRVVDPGRTTSAALDETLGAAPRLEGFAMVWIDGQEEADDRAVTGTTTEEDRKIEAGTILNVAVTGDTAAAEERLRETWGGPLCVSIAEHTERELQQVQSDVQGLPGVLTTGSPRPDLLEVGVVHDDGTLQDWVDQAYGEGLVEISSALRPAGG